MTRMMQEPPSLSFGSSLEGRSGTIWANNCLPRANMLNFNENLPLSNQISLITKLAKSKKHQEPILRFSLPVLIVTGRSAWITGWLSELGRGTNLGGKNPWARRCDLEKSPGWHSYGNGIKIGHPSVNHFLQNFWKIPGNISLKIYAWTNLRYWDNWSVAGHRLDPVMMMDLEVGCTHGWPISELEHEFLKQKKWPDPNVDHLCMYVMLCHAMPCHVMPCHVMPCHAMSCHVMYVCMHACMYICCVFYVLICDIFYVMYVC